MKKLILILLAAAMFINLTACGNGSSKQTDGSTNGTGDPGGSQITTGNPGGTTGPNNPPSTPNQGGISGETKPITGFEPAGEKTVSSFGGDYTATYTGAGFEANVGIDYSKYDFAGSGADLTYYCTNVMKEAEHWKGKKIKYEVYQESSGDYRSMSSTAAIAKYTGVLANFIFDEAAKTVTARMIRIEPNVSIQVSKVSAPSGAYLMLEYYSNVSVLYQAAIGTGTKNIDSNKYDTDKFSATLVTDKNTGLSYYKGYVQVTVPYVDPGEYNITVYTYGDNKAHQVVAEIPLTITDNGKYGETEFHVLFGGDWSKVTAKGYMDQLQDLFYNSYSRLYYRWNTANQAAHTVQFIADPYYDGAAYSMGHEVVVSTDFANANPTAIGTYCHEITHQVQNYGMNYDDRAYFTENMANYGGHRYFHWANANGKYVQLYEPTDMNILNWTRTVNGKLSYEPYGDGSKWFLSFLDWMFPSTYKEGTENELGYKRIETRGLIDEINYRAQHGGINDYDPDDPNSAFSKLVQQVSNGEFQTYEDVRLFYVLQLLTYAKDNGKVSPDGLNDPNSEISKLVKDATKQNGGTFAGYSTYAELYAKFETQMKNYKAKYGQEGWCFMGFVDYTDNFITEDLPYTENSNYPTMTGTVRGDKTADRLATPVTEGNNLLSGATLVRDSGNEKSSAKRLIDGKLNTVWNSSDQTIGDSMCLLNGIAGYIVIDLGEAKTFDTYTLYHGTYKNTSARNNTDWELLVSDDGENWTSVDNQTGMGKEGIESYKIPSTTARYVMLRLYPNAGSTVNSVCLYEMQLY